MQFSFEIQHDGDVMKSQYQSLQLYSKCQIADESNTTTAEILIEKNSHFSFVKNRHVKKKLKKQGRKSINV